MDISDFWISKIWIKNIIIATFLQKTSGSFLDNFFCHKRIFSSQLQVLQPGDFNWNCAVEYDANDGGDYDYDHKGSGDFWWLVMIIVEHGDGGDFDDDDDYWSWWWFW